MERAQRLTLTLSRVGAMMQVNYCKRFKHRKEWMIYCVSLKNTLTIFLENHTYEI